MAGNGAPKKDGTEGKERASWNTGEEMKQSFETIVETLIEQQEAQVAVINEAILLTMRGLNADPRTHGKESDAAAALRDGLQKMMQTAESDLATLRAAQSDPVGYFAKLRTEHDPR